MDNFLVKICIQFIEKNKRFTFYERVMHEHTYRQKIKCGYFENLQDVTYPNQVKGTRNNTVPERLNKETAPEVHDNVKQD
jgi:hypothetical protein